MANEDVIVTVGADASGLRDTVRSARKELGKLDDSLDDIAGTSGKVARATKGAAAGTEKFKKKAEDLNRAGQVLGGTVGSLGGKLDAFASLAHGGAGAVGALVTVSGAAAVAALTAFGVAVARLGDHVVATAQNIHELTENLSTLEKEQLRKSIDALEDAEEAMRDLGKEVDKLSIRFSAEFAGNITSVSDALSGVLITTREGLGALDEGRMDRYLTWLQRIGTFTLPEGVKASLGLAGAAFSYFEAVGANADNFDPRDINFEAPPKPEPPKTPAASNRPPADGFDDDAIGFGLPFADFNIRMQRGAVTGALDEMVETGRVKFKELASFAQEAAVEIEEPLVEAAQSFDLSWGDAIGNISNSLFSLTQDLIGMMEDTTRLAELQAQVQSEQFRRMTTEQQEAVKTQLRNEKKAAQERWAASQAVALAQAAVNAALTITQSFAQLGPIAGAVAAVAAGATVAAQIGIIATQQPKFHVGGLAPDEYSSGGRVYRDNEATVTLTRQAVEALGGAAGIGSMNATGNAPAMGDIYLVADGQAHKARRFAGPKPGYGRKPRGW